MSDRELLREFLERRSESAFQRLAQKHIDLVYGTALRRVNDSGLAEEIAQEVFIALARRAPRLRWDMNLAGWLYKATLLQASRRYRDEQRRKRREELAVEMGATMKDEDSLLKSLAPALDDALLGLSEKDRQALLLRFFEKKNFREIALELGIGEDAAQKRVAKSLGQLTQWFRRRGYGVPTAAALAAALDAASQAAPSGLAALAAQGALAAAASASLSDLGLWMAKLMILTKTQTAVVCVALLSAPVVYQWHNISRAQAEHLQRAAEMVELRRAVGLEERFLAQLESRQLAAERSGDELQERWDLIQRGEANRHEDPATRFLWDERSDYVRLPKALASRLTFAEFEMRPRGKDKPERVQRPALAKDGTPAPALLEALGFTAEEAQSVNEATRKVFADFYALTAQHGTWTNANFSMLGGGEYKTWLTFAMPEQGRELRENYDNCLTQTLGEERAQVFWRQTKDIFRDALNEFGQAPHAVTVALTRYGKLQLGEMFFRPDGSDRLNSSSDNSDDIRVPESLKPTLEAWKNAALTATQTRKP
jgi:RNA polymerase sigma factor (sigma-70 family)